MSMLLDQHYRLGKETTVIFFLTGNGGVQVRVSLACLLRSPSDAKAAMLADAGGSGTQSSALPPELWLVLL